MGKKTRKSFKNEVDRLELQTQYHDLSEQNAIAEAMQSLIRAVKRRLRQAQADGDRPRM